MTRGSTRILTRFFVMAIALAMAVPILARADEVPVRAKIGIQILSGEKVMRAKSRDRLKVGDMLRIYVHPEHACYVYVIHSDQKTATLLNTVEQRVQGSSLVMPSLHQYYQVDGKSASESFTIICSPKELAEVSGTFEEGLAPHVKWAAVQEGLTEQSRIDLTQVSDRPFAIAGNVRGAGGAGQAGGDPFSSRLRIYSGRSLLVKYFAFQVRP